MTRRTFVARSFAAASALGHAPAQSTTAPIIDAEYARAPVPATPANACDAHFHIIDGRFPSPDKSTPSGTTFEDYLVHQRRIGTQRAVPVQPKLHRTDPTCLLDALSRFGDNARGIAVVRPEVRDAELRRLDAGRVRGLRFSVWNPTDTVTTIEMIEPLAKRIASLGWHVQLHMSGQQIADNSALLERLPCPLVIDHMGRLPPRQGPNHPAFQVIRRLIDKGDCWVKLAGAYLNTEEGPPYFDATRIAQALVKAAPERLVWGSDWPHTTEAHKPDDVALLDLLSAWAPDTQTRLRILVDNPARLYGFPSTPIEPARIPTS